MPIEYMFCFVCSVANRDWVYHQACSRFQYSNVIANLFIIGNYFDKLR